MSRPPVAPITSLYDALVYPLERMGLARLRRWLWSGLPADGGPGLEVGAGTGANLPHHPPGAFVVTTDVSHRALKHVRRKRPSAPPLVVADARALPFRSGAFGWSVATLVFCEVDDPVSGLAEVGRVTCAGAPVVLLEHVRPHGPAGWLADLLTRVTAPVWGEHFDRDTVRNAELAGLVLDDVRRWLLGGLVAVRGRRRGG